MVVEVEDRAAAVGEHQEVEVEDRAAALAAEEEQEARVAALAAEAVVGALLAGEVAASPAERSTQVPASLAGVRLGLRIVVVVAAWRLAHIAAVPGLTGVVMPVGIVVDMAGIEVVTAGIVAGMAPAGASV